ncbi:MAG: class I SAM-dependent methyltransferase [Methanobacteriaceae archaeon]|nr:class I SAM-dependent methyltransferase [Methanobacteriaceae archaeon]
MIRLVYNIKDYRDLLRKIVMPEDTVVELGCHVGNSTYIISELAYKGRVVSLDNSPESVDKMESLMKKYSNLEFLKADVRLHETLEIVFKKIDKCDVLSIDLGGGYHPDTTFKVFFIWASTLKPRETLIRNRGLIDFVNSSLAVDDFKSEEGWLESSGDDGIPPRLKELKLWSSKL